MQTIDAHHHLWRYSPVDYGWINERMQVLRRDFVIEDLRAAMRSADVDATIVVQAAQTLDETSWLLDLADANPEILGVTGWAPIASSEFPAVIERWDGRTKLKALRHVIHDEKDDNYILREDFNAGIRAMAGSGLIYEILIFERHLRQTIEFVDRHPEQVFVLDHVAKPLIAAGVVEPWASLMRELSKRENVYCKVSGMVTEAKWDAWTPEKLKPYLDVAVESFGPDRLMAGSDWPVCLVASSYERWWRVLREYFTGFSETERANVFGANAIGVYDL